MWYSQINRRYSERGLTLIEMVVVAPLIILLIGTIIVMLSNLTGDSLYTQEKNTSAYNIQNALDDIEASVRLATHFEIFTIAESPFGRDDSQDIFYVDAEQMDDAFGNGGYDVLMLKSVATDLSPYNPNRQLVYEGSGACSSNSSLYWYMLVYFVDTDSKTLRKRTILQPDLSYPPTTSTPPCTTPYQRSSCANGSPSPCVTKDEILLDNVTGMQVQYYEQPSATTAQALTAIPDAQVASITLTRGTKAGGEDITYSGTLRATRLNISNGS